MSEYQSNLVALIAEGIIVQFQARIVVRHCDFSLSILKVHTVRQLLPRQSSISLPQVEICEHLNRHDPNAS